MLSKPIPSWIFASAFALAWNAGVVNAVGFLGVYHQALSHMSGPLTLLSSDVARGNMNLALNAFLVIGSFFAGCALSALVIRHEALKLSPRYGLVLILESLFLLLAWWFLRRNMYGGECLAALACGLQNAMVSSYSGAVVRTTHMTGIVTDLGIAFGHFLKRQSIDRRRVGLYLVLLGGFFLGGICGSFGYLKIGFEMLLVPALLTGVAGSGYFLAKHFENSESQATAH